MPTRFLVALLATCSCTIHLPLPDDGGGSEDGSGDGMHESSGPGATSTSGATSGLASDSSDGSSGEAAQCDIVIDDPLETDGERYFSPCYAGETFPCTTCELWCQTSGLGPCAHVTAAAVCPPIQGEASDLCEVAGEDIPGLFRCACAT